MDIIAKERDDLGGLVSICVSEDGVIVYVPLCVSYRRLLLCVSGCSRTYATHALEEAVGSVQEDAPGRASAA